MQRIERITGHKLPPIRTIEDLNQYFRACIRAAYGPAAWKGLKRAAIESEHLRMLGTLPDVVPRANSSRLQR